MKSGVHACRDALFPIGLFKNKIDYISMPIVSIKKISIVNDINIINTVFVFVTY